MATISPELFSELDTSTTVLYPQRRRSLSLECSKVSSKDPGPLDDHHTPKQAHSSKKEPSTTFQPSQHTVDDFYTPVYHLLSHDQVQRYPHTSPYQLALPPNRMHDHNVPSSYIALQSSFSTSFRADSLLVPSEASTIPICLLLEDRHCRYRHLLVGQQWV